MSASFEDGSLGLVVRGSRLIPNNALFTKIAVYTPEITQAILSEHPELVGKWLERLHKQYVDSKRSCETEDNPTACFNISLYDEFERHYATWQDGGLITIELSEGTAIRIRNNKYALTSQAIGTSKPGSDIGESSSYTCTKCFAVFKNLDEFEKHLKQEKDVKPMDKGRSDRDESRKKIPPNPIWWTTADQNS